MNASPSAPLLQRLRTSIVLRILVAFFLSVSGAQARIGQSREELQKAIGKNPVHENKMPSGDLRLVFRDGERLIVAILRNGAVEGELHIGVGLEEARRIAREQPVKFVEHSPLIHIWNTEDGRYQAQFKRAFPGADRGETAEFAALVNPFKDQPWLFMFRATKKAPSASAPGAPAAPKEAQRELVQIQKFEIEGNNEKFYYIHWFVPEAKFQTTPEWTPEQEPIFPVAKAIAAARKYLQSIGRAHDRPVLEACLQKPLQRTPGEKRYFYFIKFEPTEDADLQSEYNNVVVLLDGTVVAPVVKEG